MFTLVRTCKATRWYCLAVIVYVNTLEFVLVSELHYSEITIKYIDLNDDFLFNSSYLSLERSVVDAAICCFFNSFVVAVDVVALNLGASQLKYSTLTPGESLPWMNHKWKVSIGGKRHKTLEKMLSWTLFQFTLCVCWRVLCWRILNVIWKHSAIGFLMI